MSSVGVAALLSLFAVQTTGARTVEFVYSLEVAPEVEPGHLTAYIPLARTEAGQEVLMREVRASLPGLVLREPHHGNLVWFGQTERRQGRPNRVEIRYRIRRVPQHTTPHDGQFPSQYLASDPLTPVGVARLRGLLRRVDLTEPSPKGRARAIFDFVAGYMQERRVGTGWGRADAHWAARYGHGDDSDFAALFVALARSWEIPARLRFGVELPEAGGGRTRQRAWAEFYLRGAGWVPVDVAAASSNPERRDDYFGRLPADRLALSTGVAPELEAAQSPVPFLLYPHLELNGRPVRNLTVNFRFRALDD